MRRFEFSDSTSNKFWEVEVKGKTLNVTFGKIGTKGQSKPKDFATPEKAKAEMEKLIKEKTGKGYMEVGGKAVKAAKVETKLPAKSPATKPAAKPPAGKKTIAESMSEGLSKAEKQAKAEKVLLMFAGGQWELARGILEVAQDEHWLFEELLEGCKIDKYGLPIPSKVIRDAFGEKKTFEEYKCDEDKPMPDRFTMTRPIKSELSMLEVLLHLPNDLQKLQKLQSEVGIKLIANMLSNYWKEVVKDKFEGVMYGYPEFFSDQWYEARKAEIARVKKECEARGSILKMPWKEEEDLGKGVKLEMILIPAGKFLMGPSDGEQRRHIHMESQDDYEDWYEVPDTSGEEVQHEVTLTKPYYIGKYAVTQEQWEVVMGDNPSFKKGAKLPVTYVSWDDCKKFVKKLNAKTKGSYRLPTEAEWEYACRAGTTTAYSFGDKITPKDANYRDSEINDVVKVGSYRPNAFGLYDMHGNVWEWCEDMYDVSLKDFEDAVTDPKGPATGWERVLRGGSAGHIDSEVRSSSLVEGIPSCGGFCNGFRLARTI